MKVGPKGLTQVLRSLAVKVEWRKFYGRVLEVRPQSLSELLGNWYERIEPWRKNVNEFDRLLLGILKKKGQKQIGLHFSSSDWETFLKRHPFFDALRTAENGSLHYYKINPQAGSPKVLSLFPNWANRGRNYLMVIDPQKRNPGKKIKSQSLGQEERDPVIQVTIEAPHSTPIFYRSEWLIKEPIPLLNLLDLIHHPDTEEVKTFVRFGLIYRSVWQQDIGRTELQNFYLMLFAVANGLRLIEALEALKKA